MKRTIWLVAVMIIVVGVVALGALGVNVPYMVSTLIVYPLSVLTSYGALTFAMLLVLIYLAVRVSSLRHQLTRIEQRLEQSTTTPATQAAPDDAAEPAAGHDRPGDGAEQPGA